MKKYLIISAVCVLLLSSCSEEFLEIVPPNDRYEREIFEDISRAQGFLNPAYNAVRRAPWLSLEYCTDNAVANSSISAYGASGISAESSPVSGEWDKAIGNIIHINEFFKKGFNVRYSASDSAKSADLKRRVRGEAFGLRAYYKWLLLKNFAGPSSADPSVMLGFPIINKVPTLEEVNSIPRSTYMECYNDISNDLDSALIYINIRRYAGAGDIGGEQFTSRISGEVIYAIRARMALFAASPAYEQISWVAAADTIYNAIRYIDATIVPMQPFGDFNNVKNRDHFWRVGFSVNGNLEKSHFPPSLFGRGQCNPSQNLVDVFGDSAGYPIDNFLGYYEALTPYKMRDPRMESLIFYNGQEKVKIDTIRKDTLIETFIGGADAAGTFSKRGTRTGYYMKKFLSSKVNFDVTSASPKGSDNKIYPIFTRAGLYLDFAEAAVNAYGLAGKSPTMVVDVSAKAAILSIRTRGGRGILLDDYANSPTIPLTLEELKALIANERRIELAFTGERYYDVRRLKLPLSVLNQPVMGIKITKTGNDTFDYSTKVEIEKRVFTENMYYNPIPRLVIYRSNALIQNNGWHD